MRWCRAVLSLPRIHDVRADVFVICYIPGGQEGGVAQSGGGEHAVDYRQAEAGPPAACGQGAPQHSGLFVEGQDAAFEAPAGSTLYIA